MNDKKRRELALVLDAVSDFRKERVSLNALVQRIEAVRSILDDPLASDALFPSVLTLEQINASIFSRKGPLEASVAVEIESCLGQLEHVIGELRR